MHLQMHQNIVSSFLDASVFCKETRIREHRVITQLEGRCTVKLNKIDHGKSLKDREFGGVHSLSMR